MSDDERKDHGVSRMQTLIQHYSTSIDAHAPFLDRLEILIEWERCKDVVVQQKSPCHTIQSPWKLLTANHPGSF
jgi:hypothetical protein